MEKIIMDTKLSFPDLSNMEINIHKIESLFGIPENPDDLNLHDSFIEKLVQQQECLNCFRDTCNQGISFYPCW